MKPDELRAHILNCLTSIAPEANPAELQSSTILRDQLDLDSIDLLNFFICLHKQFKIEIPEQDYPQLMTLDGCVRYISARVPDGTGGAK